MNETGVKNEQKKQSGAPPESATESGLSLPLCSMPRAIDAQYLRQLGLPGEYPYTRGIHPSMYRGRLWTMRQYSGFGTATDTNTRFKYLLAQGGTGLSIAFDLPTQLGLDSDHPLARSETGKVGVAIDSLADMELLFDSIRLDEVSISMTINAPAAIIMAMYVAVANKQGVTASALRGTIQNDILKEYVARGTYIFPPAPSMRLTGDLIEWSFKHASRLNPISISGYHIREAGSTAVQEIAFCFANGIAYVEQALARGLLIDEFAPRLTFFFSSCSELFEEVSKFRAARRLWARLMKERFGAVNSASMKLRFHTQTAGHTLTPHQIDNNISRVTVQALAAILGGTQSLHTNAKDEALSLPTEAAVQTALRTQQILAHECGLTGAVDPLGGSYLVEQLTDEMEARARELIGEIDAQGGALASVNSGFMQRQIEESAFRLQSSIENKERIVVGLNQFCTDRSQTSSSAKSDANVSDGQIYRLNQVRASRDYRQVQQCLAELRACARSSENIFPFLLKAVESYATIGEICLVLKDEFGEYRP